MLTITHTREAGTLIDSTERGDGTNVVLKAHRWRFIRNLGTWYVPQSRDRAAKVRTIETTAAALREAGYDVEVTIDDTARLAAVVEADKIARQAARADALAAKADRKAGAADAAYARHEAAVDRLPEGGEPIKVGHHSEKRHRRGTERAWSTLGTAVHAQRDADAAQQAAATAAATTGARYNPVTVGNRIDRLAAQIRKYERELVALVYDPNTGYRPATEHEQARRRRRLEPTIAEARDNLAHWESVRAQQIADGAVTDYGPHNVTKGDEVKIDHWWRRVARVNAKSVSVETDYSWTDRAPWHEVTDHRAAQTA
ncbi:DUF3560 domain-containing protein [Cellulosimicrobium sp. TH-20]|uniref:DUF3560 domain-containing protein n=1 Tax=Cellulosimicrobium sp. TH-20 TaxID=1980001 RepID=UPI0011A056C7|nr:DUF3560 domain-containing protein [Cellulosimicrobium sp. TH-20]